MDGLMLHGGGVQATLAEIGKVPMPKQTDTYEPVNHRKLIETVSGIVQDSLPVKFKKGLYGLAKDGDRLFAHLTFTNGLKNKEMGMHVGIVNSYDKILRVKIAVGATVFVCDNLMLSGDIQWMRKHTPNVWGDIQAMTETHIGTLEGAFEDACDISELLKKKRLNDEQMRKVMGMAYGERLLTNPMMSIVRKEWEDPTFKDFKKRNAWSLYNAFTYALKKSTPRDIMEKHKELHTQFTADDGWLVRA